MDKKIILFDFDKTISDTNGFVEKFCFELNRLFSIPKQITLVTFEEYKSKLEFSTDFRPEDFSQDVSKKTGIDLKLIEECIFNPKNFPVFEEVRHVLTELSIKNRLGIFSEGFDDWQKKKIKLSGLWDFFDPDLIIIERRKLSPESINKIPTGAVVIDDKRIVIENLANTRPDLYLVWINRLNGERIEAPQIRTIKNLDELLTID